MSRPRRRRRWLVAGSVAIVLAGGAAVATLGRDATPRPPPLRDATDTDGGGDGGPLRSRRDTFRGQVTLTATVTVSRSGEPGLEATAPVNPVLLYRFRPDEQLSGELVLPGALPDAPCAAVTIDIGYDPATGQITDPEAATQPVIRCRIPPGVRMFPGLSGELRVLGEELTDVVVVPARAVAIEADGTTVVHRVEPDGTLTRVPVTLGPTDGLVAVILEGLEPDVPVADRTEVP